MRIELLYFEGCPSYAELLPRLRELLASEGIDQDVELRRVESPEEAEHERFLGSPTVRIDGEDVDPTAKRRDHFGIECRLYRTENGFVRTPPEEWIRTAVEAASRSSTSTTSETVEADRINDLTPFLHVSNMEASIAFYETLGLAVDDTYEQDGQLVWASMRCGSAGLMLAKALGPIEPSGARYFLYTENLVGLRERLQRAGWQPPEIVDGTPGPKHEMALCDPDRHFLTIAQIGN